MCSRKVVDNIVSSPLDILCESLWITGACRVNIRGASMSWSYCMRLQKREFRSRRWQSRRFGSVEGKEVCKARNPRLSELVSETHPRRCYLVPFVYITLCSLELANHFQVAAQCSNQGRYRKVGAASHLCCIEGSRSF